MYVYLRIVWQGQLEEHSLHCVHIHIVKLPHPEDLEEVLDRSHAVAGRQGCAGVVEHECQAHLLFCGIATLYIHSVNKLKK